MRVPPLLGDEEGYWIKFTTHVIPLQNDFVGLLYDCGWIRAADKNAYPIMTYRLTEKGRMAVAEAN